MSTYALKNIDWYGQVNKYMKLWYILENKRENFKAVTVSELFYGCTIWSWMERQGNDLDKNYPKMMHALLEKNPSTIILKNIQEH